MKTKKGQTSRFPVVRRPPRSSGLRELTETTGDQARIKKIMQADEDVGKVAQATPLMVCESSFPLSRLPRDERG